MEKQEEDDVRMMREVVAMANTLEKDIQLTMDVPSTNSDGKLPVLDLKMWVEEREGEKGERYAEIMHEYYEKEMVSKRVIGKDSALSEKVKCTTLAQEVIRMLRNTSESIREERKKEQLTNLAVKLKNSGYNERSRREILLSGIRGFERIMEDVKKGRRSLNRSRRENMEVRMLKKYGAKSRWFKGGRKKMERESRNLGKGKLEGRGGNRYEEIEAVLFVPATPGGVLTKRLQEADDREREGTREKKVKFVELGGDSIKSKLSRNNPWSRQNCGRGDCFSCTSGEKHWGECKREGVVYTIRCLKCKGKGVVAEYWGETARTA